MTLVRIIEALLFSAQKPLTPKEFAQAIKGAAQDDELARNEFAKTNEAEVAAALEQLKIEYIEQQRAFQVLEKADGWQLASDPAYARWVRGLFPAAKPQRLSPPALETLAIIAYRQPITRADVEAVRGVAVDGMLQSLMERGLVRIAGRADVPGRPLLYETTQFFLEHFGLRNLDELPNSEELRRRHLPTAPVPQAATPVQPELPAEQPAPEEPEQATAAEPAEEAPVQPAEQPAGSDAESTL
jgi:segregation and condensation protein B